VIKSIVTAIAVSEARMRDMFKAVDAVLRTHKEVGEYSQTIEISLPHRFS
jgi:phosphomannomutase/phosphoglucomutase